MKPLIIEATENSPAINFNTSNNIFEITGNSRPENPAKFYEYIIQWVENYGKHLSWKNREMSHDRIILKVRLDYFNSTSAKHLLILLEKFNSIVTQFSIPVDISWYYDDMDVSMQESGEEYKNLLPNVKFHLIANPQ
jgi:hypothetical protein